MKENKPAKRWAFIIERRLGFIFIQNLHISLSTPTHPVFDEIKDFDWFNCHGGIIAAGLSYLLAQLCECIPFCLLPRLDRLEIDYRQLSKQITQGLEKVTWALHFCSVGGCYGVLTFIAHVSLQKTRGAEENEQPAKTCKRATRESRRK